MLQYMDISPISKEIVDMSFIDATLTESSKWQVESCLCIDLLAIQVSLHDYFQNLWRKLNLDKNLPILNWYLSGC